MKDPLSHHRTIKLALDYAAIGTVEEFKRLKEEDELRKAKQKLKGGYCRYPNETCVNQIYAYGKIYCDSVPNGCKPDDEA